MNEKIYNGPVRKIQNEFIYSRRGPQKLFEVFKPWHTRNTSIYKNHIQVVMQTRANNKRLKMRALTVRTNLTVDDVYKLVNKLLRSQEAKR